MTGELRHLRLLARRELLENLRTRGFWISVFVLPVVVAAMSAVPVLIATTGDDVRFSVSDASGWVLTQTYARIVSRDLEQLAETATDDPESTIARFAELLDPADRERAARRISDLTLNGERPAPDDSQFVTSWFDARGAIRAALPDAFTTRYEYVPLTGNLNRHLADGVIDGYFVIPEDPVASPDGASYVTENLTRNGIRNAFSTHVSRLVRERRLREEGVPADLVRWIQSPVRFDTAKLSDGGNAVDADIDDTLQQWAPAVFVYVLLISVLSVSQMLLTNTVEEKSSRLAELLLSSVTPETLMLGKILGVAATSLTMLLCWGVLAGTALLAIDAAAGTELPLDLLGLIANPVLVASFVVYFLLGYLFYAGVLVAIGSLCGTLKEAQNLAMPVQFLLFVPLATIVPIVRDPNGWLAVTLTWVPPFTPFVMMNRAADPPHAVVYVLTTLLLAASIVYVIRLAARIFAAGLLGAERPRRLRQLWQLARIARGAG